MTDKNNQDSWNNKEPARKILPLPDTDNADDTAMMSLIRIIRITRLKTDVQSIHVEHLRQRHGYRRIIRIHLHDIRHIIPPSPHNLRISQIL